MAIARRLDGLTFFAENDLKEVISIIGFDLTGVTGLFNIATAPEQSAAITATVTILDVSLDDDGVPTSILQAFAAKSAIASAVTSLAPADPGADIPLYYEFRVSKLPGDAGTDAETTLFYGTSTLKGSI